MSAPERPRAVVLGVQLPDVDDADHRSSLEELGRLGHTLGYQIQTTLSQRRVSLSKGSVCGRGKLVELARWTGGTGVVPSAAPKAKRNQLDGVDDDDDDDDDAPADDGAPDDVAGDGGSGPPSTGEKATIVLVDHDLSPSQARNLEKATGAEIFDRTSVILSIFQRHARSREARLQVEIARLAYETPRLRESTNRGQGRQRGGGSGGRGAGDSAHELDRRRVRDRIAELRREIADIQAGSDTRRHKRADQPTVALVGYTNAGKSSLMRRLTGSEVYVADKLFATLDTTVRALHPPTKPRILATDTVGFIKKLPHDLVASFRSTLEEARDADLLLHVVDASDPAFPAQIAVTDEVLGEIGALENERWLVLNKIDRVPEQTRAELTARYPAALQMSTLSAGDVSALHGRLVEHFERDMVEVELHIPYSQQAKVAQVHATWRVLSESHDEEGTHLRFKAPPGVVL